MKRKIQTIVALLFAFGITQIAIAQEIAPCAEHTRTLELKETHPELYKKIIAERKKEAKKKPAHSINTEKGIVYTIPVVYHVLHQGGSENISDEQIFRSVEILNRDYRLQNADTAAVDTAFADLIADVEIEFVLATTAPNGECFRGITRTASDLTFDGSSGGNQLDAIVDGNNVYQGNWPGDEYLNIIVADDIGGAAGYTYRAASWTGASMQYNSIWVLATHVGDGSVSGSIGSISNSRTLTHEVGHWLGLPHVWGGTNNPNLTENCNDDDGVADTPLCMGSQVGVCDKSRNTCDGDNGYWGFDKKDPVQNYMDYSYCSMMFSLGQRDVMRGVIGAADSPLNNDVASRVNIVSSGNLAAVGADGTPELCAASFLSDKKIVCPGGSVQFEDDSYNVATGWDWTFEGGTPATSTDENPMVTYDAPGVYSVELTATDGTNFETKTETTYITVLNDAGGMPFQEGFEAYTSLDATANWVVENPGDNAGFEITSVGYDSEKSVKLNNFSESGENIDELYSSSVDLTDGEVGNTTLSFRYSYRKKNSGDYETMRVYFSSDCGETWYPRKTLAGFSLGSEVETSAWTPSSTADWETVHIVFGSSVFEEYFIPNFRYYFSFEGSGGNNIYIDDINIYKGNGNLGIDDIEGLGNVTLYPNPTSGEVNLRFGIPSSQTVEITMTDLAGKTVSKNVVNAVAGSNLVMLDGNDLSNGIYLINLNAGGVNETLRFVKK